MTGLKTPVTFPEKLNASLDGVAEYPTFAASM